MKTNSQSRNSNNARRDVSVRERERRTRIPEPEPFCQWASSASRRGFTLIELLLVLVILGILAALVVPKFSGRTEQAREQQAVTQISTFKTALETFEVDTGQYPRGLIDLIAQPRDVQNWRGPYLQSDVIPKDPWGNEYLYRYPGSHQPALPYDVSSSGPPEERQGALPPKG